jgi:hypothetical protein
MAKTVELETWYLAVDCAKCGKPIPFGEEIAPAILRGQ